MAAAKLHKRTRTLDHGTLRWVYARLCPTAGGLSPVAGRSVYLYLRENQQMRLVLHSEEQKKLTSVDLFCVAAGRRPRTGCGGGGEEFMHQHDSATPEYAASTANSRQYACTETYMATRQEQHSSNRNWTWTETGQDRTGSSSIQVWLLEIIRILDLPIKYYENMQNSWVTLCKWPHNYW